MAAARILVARGSFACEIEGKELLVRQGERIASDHPIAKAHAAMFDELDRPPDIERPAAKRKRTRA